VHSFPSFNARKSEDSVLLPLSGSAVDPPEVVVEVVVPETHRLAGGEDDRNGRCRSCQQQIYRCSENSVWPDLQILYFRLQIIDKSYRQVLTPVNNSQLLLKPEILDKFRLVTFHKIQHKETATL